MFIPVSDFFPSRVRIPDPDPGSRGKKTPESRIRIRNTDRKQQTRYSRVADVIVRCTSFLLFYKVPCPIRKEGFGKKSSCAKSLNLDYRTVDGQVQIQPLRFAWQYWLHSQHLHSSCVSIHKSLRVFLKMNAVR